MNVSNELIKKIFGIEKSEIFMRLREDEVLVYKNGGKILDVTKTTFKPSRERISLNDAFVKNKGIKKVIEKIDVFAKEIMSYGFGIKLSTNKIVLEYSNDDDKYKVEREKVLKKVKEIIENKYECDISYGEKKVVFSLKENLDFSINGVYLKFLKVWKKLIDSTSIYGVCKKIGVNISITSNNSVCEEIINCSEEEFMLFIDVLGDISKNYETYVYSSGGGVPQTEKAFQQKIMNILNDNHDSIKKEKIINCPNSVFTKNTIPFEMEWVEDSVKARIDNIFLEGDKVVLCEVKYNESVIGGTNGIHKHLDDLYKLFSNDKKKNAFVNRINKCIKERFNILKEFGFEYDILPRYEKFEYLILCGYGNGKKEVVNDELKRVSALRCCEVIENFKINCTIEDYKEELFKLGVLVKFVVVDENLSEYEKK